MSLYLYADEDVVKDAKDIYYEEDECEVNDEQEGNDGQRDTKKARVGSFDSDATVQGDLLNSLMKTKVLLNLKTKVGKLEENLLLTEQHLFDAANENEKLKEEIELKNGEINGLKSELSNLKRNVIGYARATLGILNQCVRRLLSARIQTRACISSTHTAVASCRRC